MSMHSPDHQINDHVMNEEPAGISPSCPPPSFAVFLAFAQYRKGAAVC